MARSVLLAGDNLRTRNRVRARLTVEGIDLYDTMSGHDTVISARRLQPDLVAIDVEIPGLDGYDLCRLLKRDRDTCKIPVFLLFHSRETFDRERAHECSSDGHLLVTNDPSDLSLQILRALDAAGARAWEGKSPGSGGPHNAALLAPSPREPRLNTRPTPGSDLSAAPSPPTPPPPTRDFIEALTDRALSKLAGRICEQVVERVEQIAWEVVPEMTETLIREEIQRLRDETPQ